MESKRDTMNGRNYVQKLIEQFLNDNENRIALKLYDGIQVTDICYKRFAEDILYTAGFFKEREIAGKHIALIGPNSYEWLVSFLAITASGNVAVLMNPDLPWEILQQQCSKADVSLICGDESIVSALSKSFYQFSYSGMKGKEKISVSEMECLGQDDVTLLMFTSGTTAKSKVVEISYANMNSSICSEDEVFSVPESERILTVLPMFHIAGLRGVLSMLYRYKTLCMGRGPIYLFKDMSAFSPSYVQLVPMIAESIVKIIKHTPNRDMLQKYLGTSLKRICIGGATVDPAICRFLIEQGFIVDSGYAMTETTGVGTWGQWDEKHFNTIGKLSKELQCRIEDGELLFKGPAIMKGYYKDPEATDQVVKDGWLYSGDLGFCDEEGYYYVTGRKKQLIVMPNGEKINPEELEVYFKTCESIRECMIYYNGNVICMVIYTKDREKAEEFIKVYNERMPLAYQVRKIKYYSEPLKKTGSGKIMWKEKAR